jgi:hypothetical protein
VVVDTIELTVDPSDPGASLDVSFSVERSLKPEPNTAEIQIRNLNADHRSQLEELDQVPCTVEAGYEQRTTLLFSGTLRTAFTTRESATLVTNLQSGDGEKEYQQSRVNLSIAKGTPNTAVIQQIVGSMKIGEGNLSANNAALSAAPLLLPQGGVLSGAASQIMTRVSQSLGFEWSIQDGVLQLLQVSQPLVATAVLLTSNTGLVGSPSVDSKGVLTAQSLLIPDIFPGRLLVLESERLQGNYRVEKCAYAGDTAGTDWYIDMEAKKL